LIDCVENCWPHLEGWASAVRERIGLGVVANLPPETLLAERLAPKSRVALSDGMRSLEPKHDDALQLTEFLGRLHSYGEQQFRLAALSRLVGFNLAKQSARASDEELASAFAQLGDLAAAAAVVHVREYLASHWLLPWQTSVQKQLPVERYGAAIRIANLLETPSMKSFALTLPSGFKWSEGLQDDINHILSQAFPSIAEFGFDRFCDRVLAEGGQWGERSMIGSGRRIPIIPGQGSVSCDVLAIALARGTSVSSPSGLPKVLHSVNEHMVKCGSIVRAVILLTDSWGPKVVAPHEGGFEAHRQKGCVILPVLVSRNTLGQITWP